MKVLYVVSGNKKKLSPFIQEQTDSIIHKGVIFDFFFIKGSGVLGYLKNILSYYSKINSFKPDIIHAHYGLSGFFANLQFKVPVVTTFHGSDVNMKRIRLFSFVAHLFSNHSIFVSDKIAHKIPLKKSYSVIPCGINTNLFYPIEKSIIRDKLGYAQHEKLVLFSSDFSTAVKNYPLAKQAIDLFDFKVKLIELKGFNREEVNELLNVCDVALMTSFSEGSPQFIKEALACNIPIVSTDVGDVRHLMDGIEGCYVSSYDPLDIKNSIEKAFSFGKRTEGRKKIENLSVGDIANKIIEVYRAVGHTQSLSLN